MSEQQSPFAAILKGEESGTVIARDDEKRMAIIESIEPEAAVHWLAVPYEYGYGTAEMGESHGQRFLELVDYALRETQAQIANYPILGNGFTIKFHVGAFESISHPKLHILSTE
jgi:diadenosine tetraphosphate (Ap4A) HIT family hydrolase